MALAESLAVPLLLANLRHATAPTELRLYALHALLNLSCERSIQLRMSQLALPTLLRVARSPHSKDNLQTPYQPHTRDASQTSEDEPTLSADCTQRDLDLESRYAQSILANLSKNVRVRAHMSPDTAPFSRFDHLSFERSITESRTKGEKHWDTIYIESF